MAFPHIFSGIRALVPALCALAAAPVPRAAAHVSDYQHLTVLLDGGEPVTAVWTVARADLAAALGQPEAAHPTPRDLDALLADRFQVRLRGVPASLRTHSIEYLTLDREGAVAASSGGTPLPFCEILFGMTPDGGAPAEEGSPAVSLVHRFGGDTGGHRDPDLQILVIDEAAAGQKRFRLTPLRPRLDYPAPPHAGAARPDTPPTAGNVAEKGAEGTAEPARSSSRLLPWAVVAAGLLGAAALWILRRARRATPP